MKVIKKFALGFVGGYWYHAQKIEDKADVVVDDTTPDVKLPGEKEKSIVTLDEVRTKLVAIGELSTYSGQYTVKKGRDFFRNVLDDIRIPWTTNNVTIECEGIVKVGYDVNEIGVDIDDKSYTIYISLPEATVALFVIVSLAISCVLGLAVKNQAKLTMYSQVVFLPSIMLSGIMFSAELLPNFLESMGKLFPATWGYTLLIQKNIDVSTFIPIVIILIISVFISVQLLKKIRSE